MDLKQKRGAKGSAFLLKDHSLEKLSEHSDVSAHLPGLSSTIYSPVVTKPLA